MSKLLRNGSIANGALRHGITLLELLIVLSIVTIVVFIALPTLKPSQEEAAIDAAKEHLLYLYNQEQQYFTQHGEYVPLQVLADDVVLGPSFDQRFATDQSEVDGATFDGPDTKGPIFMISATLSDGTRYKIDQLGKVVPDR